MIPNSLLITVDRGNFKAYKVEETPVRSHRARLIQAFELTDAHGRYNDKLTDQAGRFPVGDAGSGRHMNAIAERQGIETENDRRLIKQLADHITAVVNEEQPPKWSFAAPSEINPAILKHLDSSVREKLLKNVHADLVKLDPAELIERFNHSFPNT
jgi:hypothetical protein